MRVVMPLPDRDFDTTEVAVPWRLLRDRGDKVVAYWHLERPVGAICHGVIVLARATDPATGRSVIADKRTTCLPKFMERAAFYITAWRLGRYYRTYPAYV